MCYQHFKHILKLINCRRHKIFGNNNDDDNDINNLRDKHILDERAAYFPQMNQHWDQTQLGSHHLQHYNCGIIIVIIIGVDGEEREKNFEREKKSTPSLIPE